PGERRHRLCHGPVQLQADPPRRDPPGRGRTGPDHPRRDQGHRRDVAVAMLELRDITKRFGDVLANDRVSLKVEPGTIHAIVGENGAGKSTAMRIAYGFYAADSGEVLVDGAPRNLQSPHDAI